MRDVKDSASSAGAVPPGRIPAPDDLKRYPFTSADFAERRPVVLERDDGTVVVSNAIALSLGATQLGEFLRRHAAETPDAVFLAERSRPPEPGHWLKRTYKDIRDQVDSASQWLLDHGHDASRPIAILSANSIKHGILQLAAMQIGVPVLALSPAYSLASRDHKKLIRLIEIYEPGAIFVEDPEPFKTALDRLGPLGERLILGAPSRSFERATDFQELVDTPVRGDVDKSFAEVTRQHVARIILTSGSTGDPKGVIVTHEMMLAAVEGFVSVWPFLLRRSPVMVDWLPWNHTAGANGSFNLMLRTGGTLYIDDGKPTPDGIGRSVENLRLAKPTLMFNVPSAYDALIPQMEADHGLAHHLLDDMDILLYAAAGLPQNLWDRLEALSIVVRGARIPIVSSLGSTETASPATLGWWGTDLAGSIGLPIPGVEAKLIRDGDRTEVRFRGPNITPGYWKQPQATQDAFDEEGFLRIGDAVRFADPQDISAGLLFDGRLSENFKLTTGTWVVVGLLRLDIIKACEPLVLDAVVVGENRDDLGLLVFLNHKECLKIAGEAVAGTHALAADAKVVAALRAKIEAFNGLNSGSSRRIARLTILTEPADIDAGEITDKGYLNQRKVIARRRELVERLYDADPHPDVLRFV